MRSIISGLGAAGGALLLYSAFKEKKRVAASWTVPHVPVEEYHPKWDSNWDRRDPNSIVKPIKGKDGKFEVPEGDASSGKATAVRHILLIRHGQYNLSGKTDKERTLTDFGQQQATLTGKRLAELALPYSSLIRSTMTRAIETAALIGKHLDKDIPSESCPLLHEGAPIPPEPPVGHWRPEQHQFFEDGARIEAAFRKHFHRADPAQVRDSYDVLVCHANVIRYFVCRALQFPPEAWLRFSLQHGSITWLSVQPSGRVTLRALGDTGHMPPHLLTSS
ncbi:serine/threonine-protein phosphatase PGAM5, mitochondrial isoform X1 [Cloeon dipterum]|uniref:serine/threonine-protein phosphatase PGAM5, mitochondrial isoform X1 n=1 Tax=Cloeon dipterum TaxID=197152 RepID=UPI0032204A98